MKEIFPIRPDRERARALLETAKERLIESGRIRKLVSKERMIESYYDVLKELMIAAMYADGYKTLSHVAIIEYMKQDHGSVFSDDELFVIDELRRKRNDITYYGKKLSETYLEQKETEIIRIMNKMARFVEEMLEKS